MWEKDTRKSKEDIKAIFEDNYGKFITQFKDFLKDNAALTPNAQKIISDADIQMCIWRIDENKYAKEINSPYIVNQMRTIFADDGGFENTDKKIGELATFFTKNKYEYSADGETPNVEYISQIQNFISRQTGFSDILPKNIEKSVVKIKWNDGGIPYKYRVLWFTGRNTSYSMPEKLILSVVLRILNLLNDMNSIIDGNMESFENSAQKTFQDYFMDVYCSVLRQMFDCFPDFDALTEVSFLRYEHQEPDGTIFLFPDKSYFSLKDQGMIILKEKAVLHTNIECSKNNKDDKNTVCVRKLLEVCKNCNGILIASGKGEKVRIEAIASTVNGQIPMDELQLSVEFKGIGCWKILYGKDVILMYRAGHYYTDENQEHEELSEIIDEIKEIKNEQKEKFVDILEILQKQPHGALLIISEEAKTEVQRLCGQYGRGFEIEQIDLFDKNLRARKRNLDLFKGISSIDGAVFVDFDGRCYGFSAILDGKATTDGNLGRGSRYNSANTYVNCHSGYAVIVSEDKDKPLEILCKKEQNECHK